nr:hypothetical protein [Tanacetum cinerariifolium]
MVSNPCDDLGSLVMKSIMMLSHFHMGIQGNQLLPCRHKVPLARGSNLSLGKNFDREDLEALWNLVKERFSTSKLKNFFDDFLLTTLGAMFEKPDAQAQVWKNQRTIHGQAKVKSWKILESCVRLRVKDESEMSLELLRFTRQQHQEGQLE